MRKRKGIAILFVIYLLFLIWLIVFKLNFSISSIHSVRDINLIPFHYEDVEPGDVPILEALMNLAVFIPLGFLLSKTFEKMKFGTKALVVVLLSLFFETTQQVLSIGASDITDIITNTIGGVIGLLLAHMTSFSKTKTKQKGSLMDALIRKGQMDVFVKNKLKKITYDPAALETLIRDNYADIYQYCYCHVGNKFDAQDITQEVFLKFFSALDRYVEYGKVKNYLYVIARNKVRDHWKKKSPILMEDISKAGLNEVYFTEEETINRITVLDMIATLDDMERKRQIMTR